MTGIAVLKDFVFTTVHIPYSTYHVMRERERERRERKKERDSISIRCPVYK